MAIIAVAALASDFGSAATSTTTATGRDAAYSPSNIDVPVEGGVATQLSLDTLPVAATGVVWVHFRVRFDFVNTNADGYLFTARDADGNIVGRINFFNSELSAQAYGDTTEEGDGNLVNTDAELTIDLKVDMSGANTIVSLYLDGANFPSSTATTANFVGHGVPANLIWEFFDVTDGIGRTMYLNEVIVTDGEDTRQWRLATLEPSVNGTYNAWTGDVVELGDLDPLTVATAATDGLQQSWTPTAYGGIPGPLRAVAVSGRVKRGLAGLSQVEQFVRIGVTDYPGTVQGPASGGTSKTVLDVWDVNPATLAPWDSAALATIEGGVTAKT